MQELFLFRVQSIFHNLIELATSDVSQLYLLNGKEELLIKGQLLIVKNHYGHANAKYS
jgi:hypothetical protein